MLHVWIGMVDVVASPEVGVLKWPKVGFQGHYTLELYFVLKAATAENPVSRR
jgi:hypothetical protein